MSRIGNNPIAIPEGVTVTQEKGNVIHITGKLGELYQDIDDSINVKIIDNVITLSRSSEDKEYRSKHGLYRSLINNMVVGVEKGFVKKLEIHGVGFKAAVNGQLLNLNLGYSHEINHQIPAGLNVSVENNTNITIEGADKATVGKMAAEVRAYYPVEPYKGKGVRYADELVVRKQGKQVQ